MTLHEAVKELLDFYDDVQASAGRLRSSDQWILLERRAAVVRQALRDTGDLTLSEVEALRTELKEDEGVIKCLRRHRDEAEQHLDALKTKHAALCDVIWTAITELEEQAVKASPTVMDHLALAHRLRHAVAEAES